LLWPDITLTRNVELGADSDTAIRFAQETIMAIQETSRPDRGHDRQAVLVTAASMQGATAEIADAIGKTLAEHGLAATVTPPGEVSDVDGYDAVILGSAVYTGHWLDAATDLAKRCRPGLVTRPVWLFSSGPVGQPTGKLARAMARDPVEVPAIRAATGARDHKMFAGKLDPRSLGGIQRAALLAFPGLNGDFRDWDKIRQWADGIAQQLAAASAQR
jgi:menaquinone-dependent protoporphyrinogen oxidase